MNLRELQYLVALADCRNFGRAAELCLVSQPTLSTQLRKLEEELGVTLIERAPRNVMLTPAGVDAVERARRILNEVEQLKEATRLRRERDTGTVRIGIFPTLGPYLLPHTVPQLRKQLPHLELMLVEEKSNTLLARLIEGKLDAVIMALPVQNAQLQCEPLFEEPFLLAVPQDHPLATRDKLTLNELDHYDLMLLEDGHCLRDQALEVCRLSGMRETSSFRATSLETLRQMVMAGSGITLLPKLAAGSPQPHADGIRFLAFSDAAGQPPPGRQIGMFWRKSSALGGLLREIATLFRKTAQELLQEQENDASHKPLPP